MRSFLSISSCHPCFLFLVMDSLLVITYAYKPLSDSFLRNISSGGSDFDPDHGTHLSPILIPRVAGTAGHTTVQRHFINFFSGELPRWRMEWYNSSTTTPMGVEVPIANLVFKREPPWTKQGQANWLTLAAHYDSKNFPEGFLGATDSAVPCAILLHVARSIDQYVTQMHDEMAELGEGGTVEMDMGVQILLLDGKEALDEKEPALYGSRYAFPSIGGIHLC
jgi:glutaminyl-peptide cyclotransferase